MFDTFQKSRICILLVALGSVSLVACQSVPNSENSQSTDAIVSVSATSFTVPALPSTLPPTPAPNPWWLSFGQSELNQWVDRALQANSDIMAAEANLRAALYTQDAVQANLWPTLQLAGARQSTDIQGANPLSNPGNQGSFSSASLSSSYELDAWGRLRNDRKAARLQTTATQYDAMAVRIGVAAQVCSAWAQWVATEQLIKALEAEGKAIQMQLQGMEVRFRQGVGTAEALLDLRQIYDGVMGDLRQTQAAKAQTQSALAVLLGTTTEQLKLNTEILPSLPPVSKVPVAASILNLRPDVLRGLALVKAADASAAAALANQLPQLSLRASVSDQTANTSALFDNWVRNLSVNLFAPIFDGGVRKAETQRRTAQVELALAQYQKAALSALADVDTAWARDARFSETLIFLTQSHATAKADWDRAKAAYAQGTVDAQGLLRAERAYWQTERQRIVAQQAVWLARVALYKSLSGPVGS